MDDEGLMNRDREISDRDRETHGRETGQDARDQELEEAYRRGLNAGRQPESKPESAEDERPPDTHVAILANGDEVPYSGAHPTHVSVGEEGREIPVTSMHEKF